MSTNRLLHGPVKKIYRLLVCLTPWTTAFSTMPATTRRQHVAALSAQSKRESHQANSPPSRKRIKHQEQRHAVVTPNSLPSPPKATTKTTTQKSRDAKPPNNWRKIYDLVVELRRDRTAPCDHSGAEALVDRTQYSAQECRFTALLALMLSSQTKDAVVGQAVRAMQRDGVLHVQAIHDMSAEQLHTYIRKVGFHNQKTAYIKEAVEIMMRDYQGDVPPTAAKMMQLPGVGPKMSFIAESICWNCHSGIGVDTHMHRLFNALKWVRSKTPEQTRVQLEAWLPQELWADVNLLWVGFGQEVQQDAPKILRKALDCSRPVDALKLLNGCGMDYRKVGKKAGLEEEIARVLNLKSI